MSVDYAKVLRKRITDAEKKIWKHLRNKQMMDLKFRRQQPIGPYIVDFVSFKRMLIIEIDGGQHAEQIAYDQSRDQYFLDKGYKVLRFWNNDVLQNTEGVLEAIRQSILNYTPSPCPSPAEGRGDL